MSGPPADWRRLEPLLDAVLDLPPESRAAFLVDANIAPDLRDEVERLLARPEALDGFLAMPAAEYAASLVATSMSDEDPTPSAPARVGPYRIIGEAGKGGMGTVYLAERDDDHFRQRVAVKLVRGGVGDEALVRRFREERRILAALEHPNVARLLDGGVTAEGVPWLAMEYVDGIPIDRFCDERRLGIEARLELFCTVCNAVQYAHRNLVVHRDLKPSNILVTPEGIPKLLDFGIAKLLTPGDDEIELTRTGLRLLTPEYASPEQLRGERVATASDVYSLGVLLFRLLTGRHPYDLSTVAPHEVDRAVLEAEPERPSTIAARPGRTGRVPLAEVLGTSPERLRRRLRGDLDTIVLTALRKERERRYPSARDLADDVRRHLEGRPVLTRPDTVAYRAGKFIRRHRLGVAAAALVLLSLGGGIAGITVQARATEREAQRAEAVRDFLTSLFQQSDPAFSRGDEITARELLDRGAARVDAELAGQPHARAEMLGVLGMIYRDLGLYERAEPLLRESLALRGSLFGSRHGETADAAHELGVLLVSTGRYDEAEAMHRQALEARRNLPGMADPDVARSLAALGGVLGRKAEYESAERLQREALAIQLRHFGADHPEVATTLEGLATLLRAMGEREEAENHQRRALAVREATLGHDHLATATSMNNLALLLGDRGELAEAEALYRSVLDFDLRRLGEEHPYTATVMNNLASVLRSQGRIEEAEPLYRRALELDRQLHGDVHEKVATVLNNLGLLLRDRGELEESERLLAEALATFRAINGDRHPSVGTAHALLAGVIYRRGRSAEAERLYLHALEILEAAFPDGHGRTAGALLGLGELLTGTGRAVEALPLLREAVAINAREYGDGHERTATARRALEAASAAVGETSASVASSRP